MTFSVLAYVSILLRGLRFVNRKVQRHENEADITLALQQDQRLSLEGAYRRVVFPKITAERNTMRESILKEIKGAPTATAAPNRGFRASPSSGGKKSLEQIIQEQVDANR